MNRSIISKIGLESTIESSFCHVCSTPVNWKRSVSCGVLIVLWESIVMWFLLLLENTFFEFAISPILQWSFFSTIHRQTYLSTTLFYIRFKFDPLNHFIIYVRSNILMPSSSCFSMPYSWLLPYRSTIYNKDLQQHPDFL